MGHHYRVGHLQGGQALQHRVSGLFMYFLAIYEGFLGIRIDTLVKVGTNIIFCDPKLFDDDNSLEYSLHESWDEWGASLDGWNLFETEV